MSLLREEEKLSAENKSRGQLESDGASLRVVNTATTYRHGNGVPPRPKSCGPFVSVLTVKSIKKPGANLEQENRSPGWSDTNRASLPVANFTRKVEENFENYERYENQSPARPVAYRASVPVSVSPVERDAEKFDVENKNDGRPDFVEESHSVLVVGVAKTDEDRFKLEDGESSPQPTAVKIGVVDQVETEEKFSSENSSNYTGLQQFDQTGLHEVTVVRKEEMSTFVNIDGGQQASAEGSLLVVNGSKNDDDTVRHEKKAEGSKSGGTHVSMVTVSTFTTLDNVLRELSEGQILHKVKGGGILYSRRFFLDTDSMKLLYTGSQKKFRKRPTSWALSSIEEVREGEKDYAKRLDRHDRYCVLCVVFGANHEVLYLLANSVIVRDKWVKGLRYALQLNQYLKQKENSNIWVRQAFDIADKNSDERLDFEEVMKLLKTLNADMDKTYVKEMFDAADTRRVKGEKPTLDREEFVKFYNMLTERPEIEELFLKYAKHTGFLTASDLQMFLIHEQKEDASDERSKELIVVFEPQPNLKKEEKMSLIGFSLFLTSQQQHLFKRGHRRVYQDMTQPMTNYFINSSHNTYLAEDQLRGPSRVEMYRTALKRGCRCVELDCWDGSDGDPVIYHGYTLTSKILFRDVISVVKDYAFVSSPYPVTLSIENHCSIAQQTVMAEIMMNTLGDMLYMPDQLPDQPPSPHELKNRIIVKGKKLKVTPQSSDNSGEVSDEDEAAEDNENAQQQKKSSNKLKLSPKFSSCVGMKSVHFHATEDVPSGPNFNVVSLAERKIGKLLDSEPEGICKFSRKTLIRTYPAGTRTDSSNYNPVPMWCGGCQVVALNFQTGGECMQLLHGKFLDNGNSGYTLKPPCFKSDEAYKVVTGAAKSSTRKQLTINVLSGFQLPKPKDSKKGEVIDPFLKIEIYGIQADKQEQKTTVIKNNGFNPNWKEEFTFLVEVPELALVRFTVSDSDKYVDDFIGYYVVPFNSLAQGYRHFPLFDRNGDQFEQGTMFVKVDITDPPQ